MGPGQENTLKVMTAKGEPGEAKGATLISLSLKTLQEFDSEFQAKVDNGLAEADANKDTFKNNSLITIELMF